MLGIWVCVPFIFHYFHNLPQFYWLKPIDSIENHIKSPLLLGNPPWTMSKVIESAKSATARRSYVGGGPHLAGTVCAIRGHGAVAAKICLLRDIQWDIYIIYTIVGYKLIWYKHLGYVVFSPNMMWQEEISKHLWFEWLGPEDWLI